jgi:carboxymethylenebutenolidase
MDVTRRAALATLALGPLPHRAQAESRGLSYESGGRTIAVERYDAAAGGRRPAVMLLHGSDGPGPRYRMAAQLLAAAGYHVFLVHYLDRTGESRAQLGLIARHFPAWTAAAREGVDFVARQPGVDPDRIGVLGVSLGGGLALVTAQAEPRLRAVVTYFGFLPASLDPAGRFPPTLVLHGARDRVVPVLAATQLRDLLEARRIPHEVKIYPDQGHGFTGAAALDAAQRIAGFFNRHLGG